MITPDAAGNLQNSYGNPLYCACGSRAQHIARTDPRGPRHLICDECRKQLDYWYCEAVGCQCYHNSATCPAGEARFTGRFEYEFALAEANAATLRTDLTYDMQGRPFDEANPTWFYARADYATKAEAEAIAAQFPKSLRVKVNACTSCDTPRDFFMVRLEVAFSPTGVNKGENETGAGRIRSFLRHCGRLNIEVRQRRLYGNSSRRSLKDYGYTEAK